MQNLIYKPTYVVKKNRAQKHEMFQFIIIFDFQLFTLSLQNSLIVNLQNDTLLVYLWKGYYFLFSQHSPHWSDTIAGSFTLLWSIKKTLL